MYQNLLGVIRCYLHIGIHHPGEMLHSNSRIKYTTFTEPKTGFAHAVEMLATEDDRTFETKLLFLNWLNAACPFAALNLAHAASVGAKKVLEPTAWSLPSKPASYMADNQ